MKGNDKQAYDRSTNIFSPDGRLYQVEYAREAVKRGSASLGVCAEDGVVLLTQTSSTSDLLVSDSVEKLHKVVDHVGAAVTGNITDGRKLVDELRLYAQQEELRYGRSGDVETLSKQVADTAQEATQVGGKRPFGVSILVAGYDETGPSMYEVDPSGTPRQWRAAAIGSQREDYFDYFEQEYEEDMSVEEAISLVFNAVRENTDGSFTPDQFEVATVTEDSQELTRLTDDEIAERLAEANLQE